MIKRLLFFICCMSLCMGNKLVAHTVLPYNFPEKTQSGYQKDADFCYRLIEHQAHYLLTLVKPWHNNPDYKLTTASQGKEEHITRPNTGAVAIFCFLYRFGNYDEDIVGVSREELLNDNIIPMLRYLTAVHKTGNKTFDNGKQWGGSWQSAHWTHHIGQGVCTIWKDLPVDLQNKILKLVRFEANRIAGMNPPFQLKFDSKSEENAWNAGAISAALLLMPNDANVPVWQKALQRWLLSAYLCPNDANKDIMIDGFPLKDQFEGANIYNDYTLENHGLVHPDYMTACTLKGEIMIDYLATNRKLMDACMYNLDNIYDQLKTLLLPNGAFIYPTGQDWAIFRHCDWPNLHAFNMYYYKDGEALYWLRRNLQIVHRMQQRHADGRIYAPNENNFPSSQTLAGLGLVDTWKMFMLASPLKEKKPAVNVSRVYPDACFYIRKTKKCVHTIAWGNKIQVQTMRQDSDPIMAPVWRSAVGFIKLKGEKKDLPLTLQSMQIDTLANGLRFTAVLLHGDAVRADMVVTSSVNGELKIEEKLTAMRAMQTSEIATMKVGILNHKYWIEEKGFREVRINKDHYRFVSMSGQMKPLEGNKVSIDNKLIITTQKPFKGAYRCTNAWKGDKLIDDLILNEINENRSWKKGDILNQNYMIINYK